MASINNTISGFQSGTDSVTGISPSAFTRFINTWAVGDKFTLVLTDVISGLVTTVGAGDISGLVPSFVFTYNQKVYAIVNNTVYMCAVAQPLVWNDPNASGNSHVEMANFNGTPMQLVAIAHYQGKLVFGSRDAVLIYNIASDPSQWALSQTLQNIGFRAALSVHSIGDLDVIFLSDSGFRSLRVRDSSLNAYPNDIGSPIDLIVQAVLLGASPNAEAACGIVDPASGRYWCFLKDTIYVLSDYPNNKIVGWGTYLPTYALASAGDGDIVITAVDGSLRIVSDSSCGSGGQWFTEYSDDGVTFTDSGEEGVFDNCVFLPNYPIYTIGSSPAHRYWRVRRVAGAGGVSNIWDSTAEQSAETTQVAFTPIKFDTYQGQIYCRTSDGAIVLYDSSGYDNCVATIETPFLDNKAPATRKCAKAIDIQYSGLWTVYGCMDIVGGNFTKVQDTSANQTIDMGSFPYADEGTHFKLKATCNAAQASTLASLILHYEDAGEKS